MHSTNVRLTSWALVVGSIVATAGYASAFAAARRLATSGEK